MRSTPRRTRDPSASDRDCPRLTINVIAASITALRGELVAPQLVWTPLMRCDWRMEITVCEVSTPTPQEVAASTPAAAGIETLAQIEHRSDDLIQVLATAGERAMRFMVWTHDVIAGYPRPAGRQWNRVTIDDTFHLGSRRRDGSWTSYMRSVGLSPLVDVADLPSRDL